MSTWKDGQNKLYDDMNGEALSMPSWPIGLVMISTAEADSIRQQEISNQPAVIPTSVTMRQARLALLNAGLLTTVSNAIANMPGAAGDDARIEWEFSSAVERNKPLVQSLSASLNISSTMLDDLFLSASKL